MKEIRKKQIDFLDDNNDNKDRYEQVFELLEKKKRGVDPNIKEDKLDKEIAMLNDRLSSLKKGVILKTRKTEAEVV